MNYSSILPNNQRESTRVLPDPPMFGFLNTSIENEIWQSDGSALFLKKSFTDGRSSVLRWVTLIDNLMTIYKDELQREDEIIIRSHIGPNVKIEAVVKGALGFTVSLTNAFFITFTSCDVINVETWMMAMINRCHGSYRPSENFYFDKPGGMSVCSSSFMSSRSSTFSPSSNMLCFFEKEGHLLKNWKRRLFILTSDSLRYYPAATLDNFHKIRDSVFTVKDKLDTSVNNLNRTIWSKSWQSVLDILMMRDLLFYHSFTINAETEVAVLPDGYRDRQFVFVVISSEILSNYPHQTDSIAKSGHFNEGQVYLARELNSPFTETFDRIELSDKHLPRKRMSVRIAAPDQETQALWIEAIAHKIDLLKQAKRKQ